MNRNLDGYYFRVYRESKWQNICFTDLDKKETEEVLKDRTNEWLLSLYNGLNDVYLDLINFLYKPEYDEAKKKFECADINDDLKQRIIKLKHNILCMAEIAGIVGEE